MPTSRTAAWLRSPVVPLLALSAGGITAAAGAPQAARVVLFVGLLLCGIPLMYRTARSALEGHFAADVVAGLAVLMAIVLQEPVAGLVVTLMQTGGEALERYAEGRASEAVRALEREAPRTAHRLGAYHAVAEIGVAAIVVDDLLLVRPGEMLPCDCLVVSGSAHVDTSRITGEPLPVSAAEGIRLPSGCINLDGALTVRAEATARESQYERIVELVRSAQSSKAPFQRLADRYARWFTPLTVGVCALSYAISGDLERVLSVLVVATPCPLLLAVPVAMISGINRAARQLIVVRSGAALEQLATIDTVVFDKTGTLTIGQPAVSTITSFPPFSEHDVLLYAAAVEHNSGHLLARSVVQAATDRKIKIEPAPLVAEIAGHGISGRVRGKLVQVGAKSFVPKNDVEDVAGLRAFVAVDGQLAGCIDFDDKVRPAVASLLATLDSLGVRRQVILSGDSRANTEAVARTVGIADARAELRPGDKVAAVNALVHDGARVLMVGDGTNDAPALSAATVGLALAAHGGGISAEAAGVVLLADDIRHVGDAIAIGQRTMRIARQSVMIGLLVSGAAMCVAAAGFIPPVAGAVLQEVLDVAVILNALRASRPPHRAARLRNTPRRVFAREYVRPLA